ncbi:hypothetical protein [Kribbella sp. VKM Ac-2568]|uniref:hypothetical protein n=1 Tax=Kribbella sp. VKM Ac-2568 TaxID=2512219 RepID=UPI00351A486D
MGYSINSRMKSRIAVAALGNAVARRNEVTGCVLHTDRGSQGGFNRLSQHLGHGGLRWGGERTGCRRCRRVRGGSGRRIEHCDRRCVHRAGLSPRVRCSVSSGG